MIRSCDVAIVGGGIGGLTLAASLAQQSVSVQIFEQDAELREIGAGIAVGGNATRLLQRLGIDLAQVANMPAALELRCWKDGALLWSHPIGQWVHPLVREWMAAAERAAVQAAGPPGPVIVHDVPLLAESRGRAGFDVVIVVDVPPELQVERLVGLRGMAPDQARARMAAQASREQRLAVADIVIDNSGSLADLDRRVDEVWASIQRRVRPLPGASDREHWPLLALAAQLVAAALGEGHAGPAHQVFHRARHQDLPAPSERCHAVGDLHGGAGDRVADQVHLADVDPGPEVHAEHGRLAQDGGGAADRLAGSAEGGQQAVSGGLDQPSAVALDQVPGRFVASIGQAAADGLCAQDRGQRAARFARRRKTGQEGGDLGA